MSDAGYLLTALAVVAVLAAAAILLRPRGRGGPMVEQARATPKMKGPLDAPAAGARRIDLGLGRELAPLLERGKTEEAVALVRERTGWDEPEARASVGRLVDLMKRLGME